MIDLPAMLMVGASWKNSGKTELACLLIRKFSPELDIVGLKVSSMREQEMDSSHTGLPSPVHPGQNDSYLLLEETGREQGTDTARMIASGARRAFFLRTGIGQLEKGFTEFLGIAGERSIIICESNSLRRLVRPGVFLVVIRNDRPEIKPSFQEIMHFADRIVQTDGSIFDFDPGEISFQDGKWLLTNSHSTSK